MNRNTNNQKQDQQQRNPVESQQQHTKLLKRKNRPPGFNKAKTSKKPTNASSANLEQHALDLIHQGKTKQAQAIYESLIESGHNNAEISCNLGLLCLQSGHASQAIQHLRNAIHLKPNQAIAHNNLGSAYRHNQQINLAITHYRKATLISPSYLDAWNNLGIALHELGHLDDATSAHQTAQQLDPNNATTLSLIGINERSKGNITASIRAHKQALSINASQPSVHYNAANAFVDAGHLTEAIHHYKTAIELTPEHAEAHNNLAHALLLNGDYKHGWEEYRWRFRATQHQPIATPQSKLWLPGEQLKPGSRLYLISEQGLGDSLQFLRYSKTFKQHGLDVRICADPKLHPLIQASGLDNAPLGAEAGNQISDGHWLPLLSVGEKLHLSPNTPWRGGPYLQSTEKARQDWQERLSTETNPLIAIHWQGNPITEENFLKGRSLKLEHFEALRPQRPITLVSLQKGPGSEQLANCHFQDRFSRHQALISNTWSFIDTAAILQQCALVITSDSALAHLAGGMELPTWLLLKYTPDWRWGMQGSTSFWYPSLRLFRQPTPGDWPGVLQAVNNALNIFLMQHHGDPSGLRSDLTLVDQPLAQP